MQIEEFGAILKKHGITRGAGVPCSFFKPLVNYMTVDPDLDYLPAASEGEAVAIAAGMTAAGKAAFALMQNSGLGNAINPVTSLLHPYQIPVALLVSHRGEPGIPDEPQHQLMGEITDELARLCGLRTHVAAPEDLDATIGAAQQDGVPSAWIFRKKTLEGGPKAPPLTPSYFAASVPAPASVPIATIKREEGLEGILPLLNEGLASRDAPAVVSTTGKLSRELYELDDGEHDKQNRFYMVGSMGCAAGFGLGIARVSKKVVVLDGDGAVLMKMGTLATAGALSPAGFHHVVFDNAAYESTGSQPTSAPSVDLAAVALACSYKKADTVSTVDELRQTLETHLKTDGPTLLRVIVQPGSRKDLGRPNLKPRANYERFREYLG